MNQFIQARQADVDQAIEHFKTDIGSLRTGRATPALVDNIQVLCYGVRTPIIQLASISVPEPRTIRIDPWDKNILKDVEKSINEANLGLQAVVDGKIIRINIPAMTEENRRDLTKILKEKLEKSKIELRGIREEIKSAIEDAEKDKEITEDDRFSYVEELNKEIESWNKKVIALAEAKEKEIMTV
jgi:ribosome recycling factor